MSYNWLRIQQNYLISILEIFNINRINATAKKDKCVGSRYKQR